MSMDLEHFINKLQLLIFTSKQIQTLSKTLNAVSVSINSSTSLDTSFMLILKKKKHTMNNIELYIDLTFSRGIKIYGQNITIYKELDTTLANISILCHIIMEELKEGEN